MFTWICPQCGREVPPSYSECPDCAAKGKTPPPAVAEPPAATTPAAEPPAPTPKTVPPRAPAAPPSTVVAPTLPPLRPTPARTTVPTWLMTILSALAFVGIGAGAFFGIQYFKKEPDATTRTQPQLENPPATSARPIGASPLMKHIEVAGLRLTQNKAKQTEVRFIIVNHSGAEIQNFSGNINLKARTSKQDEEPIGAFSFKIPMIGPYESKEVTTVVNTKLKVYELPDWQNLEHQIEITSR